MMRTLVFLTLLLVAPAPALAQFEVESLARPLTLTVHPEYPQPHSDVEVSISSFAIDLDGASIRWYLNGREAASGVGLTKYILQAGEANQPLLVQVEARGEDGILAQVDRRITPTVVNIIWESQTQAPPFYQGRRMAGASSPIHLQAVHSFTRNGSLIPDTDVMFTWYRNGTRIANASGRGKSTITLTGPSLFATQEISVVAESNALQGRATTIIRSIDPFAELYERHPLFGILFHKPLGSFEIRDPEIDLTAIPFFTTALKPNAPEFTYTWTVNGVYVPNNPQEPHTLKITNSGYTGPGKVELELSSSKEWTLSTKKLWDVYFGARNSAADAARNNPFGTGQ